MQQTITDQLAVLVKLRRETPVNVIAEAVEIGMSKLYMDSVLKQYLKKRISRRKAIQLVGMENVISAEQQHKMVSKDIAWGLGN